jgi:toxin ParE1/3/4
MSQFRLSRQGETDLRDIWDYIGIVNDRPEAATRLLERLYDAFLMLAERPLMGEACPHLRANLRRFVVGSYAIFYVPLADGVEIERIIHGARNIDAMF